MNAKIKSITLLMAIATMIFTSATAYTGLASASGNKDGSNHLLDNNYKPLLNCLSSEGSDGEIQWFEPLGCSFDNGNGGAQAQIRTDTQDGSNNVDVSIINYNMGADNDYTNELYGDNFEDPYEVGWN